MSDFRQGVVTGCLIVIALSTCMSCWFQVIEVVQR